MEGSRNLKFEVMTARPRVAGSRIGRVCDMTQGIPTIDFPGNLLGPRQARWAKSLSRIDLESACRNLSPVLLVFEDNDASRPVIVDLVLCEPTEQADSCFTDPEPLEVAQNAARRHTAAEWVCWQGHVTGIENGQVLVQPHGQVGIVVRARCTVPLRNLSDPVIVLQVDPALAVVVGQLMAAASMEDGDSGVELNIKAETVRIEAGSLLVLKAGGCTFELDARGRASLVGDQVVSRARVTNKVQGGSVQIN